MSFSRRAFLAALAASVSGTALANAPLSSVRPIPKPGDAKKRSLPLVEDLISSAKIGGNVSFVAVDAVSGEVLDQHRPLFAHPPASVTKAVTALYALERLGPETQFSTEILATGPVTNGVLDGDLVLAGGGDPTLDTDALYDLASALKDAGLREVRGAFRVWGGALPGAFEIDPAQPDHVGYNPAVSGLNLNFNRVFLEWKRNGSGYDITVDGRGERFRPDVAVARATVEDRRYPIFTYADQSGRDIWTVARGALGKGGGRWLPTRKPEIYAGDVFRTLVRSHGIDLPFPVKASARPDGTVLVRYQSASLQEICRGMLRFSTNLTAEVVGLLATAVGSGLNETEQGLVGSATSMNAWLKSEFGLRRARFVDHSGLGDGSRITPQEMVKALRAAGPNSAVAGILKPFAVRDDQNRVVENSPTRVVAKTGTLNFVSALAGFVRTPSGRDVVFAIFCSDIPRRNALTEAQRERPKGARSWSGRARKLQGQLINRWVVLADTDSV